MNYLKIHENPTLARLALSRIPHDDAEMVLNASQACPLFKKILQKKLDTYHLFTLSCNGIGTKKFQSVTKQMRSNLVGLDSSPLGNLK